MQVTKGQELVQTIGDDVGSRGGTPSSTITIVDCGEL